MPKSIEQIARDAARQYGLPPEYILALIQRESNFNPNAVSPTGARGLTQFTRSTGKQYGLDAKSAFDPEKNIDAAARLARDNKAAFTRRMGRDPDTGELYLTHLQGAGGATKGLRNPDRPATEVFGNQSVRVNLPRGASPNISASEFQGLHKSKFTSAADKFKNIDIGVTPTLDQLNPPPKEARPADTAQAGILRQLAPVEQDNAMARYPGFNEAIRQSLTGNTENVEVAPSSFIPQDITAKGRVKMAGFVPPSLTSGAAKTQRAAGKNVEPRGTIKDAEGAAKRSEELKNVPDASKQMEGGKGLTPDQQRELSAWSEAQDKWLNGDGPNPGPQPTFKPNVKNITDPAGAADPRTGTALERVDPNLAAQNDPAANAMIAARIRGYAKPGAGAAPGGIDNIGKAIGAAGAVAAGTAAGIATRPDEDPARAAVERQMQAQPNANVDPGVAIVEKQLGIKPGSFTDTRGPMSGLAPMMAPIMQEGLPAFQEAMKDPQVRQAAGVVTKAVISNKARIDAQRADMVKDPTYYQRQASQMDPSAPGAEQAMMRGVSRDQQGSMRGGVPQAARPPQTVPPQVAQTPQPPSVEQQILTQAGVQPAYPQPGPGQEQGDAPGPNGNVYNREASRYTNVPGANDPSGGVPQGFSAGQMPMTPAMMQLYQFFGGGGE